MIRMGKIRSEFFETAQQRVVPERFVVATRVRFLAAMSLAIALAGCGTLEVAMEDEQTTAAVAAQEPSDSIEATRQEESTPTLSPAATVIPAEDEPSTPEAARDLLPAPVYYLNSEDGQIWRVEEDGVSNTQMTSEEEPVTDFDVSPRDGALVYISGKQLIYYSSALGGRREVLLTGPVEFDPDDYLSIATQGISSPIWSPDGSWIVFGEGGISLYQDPYTPRQEGVPEVWTALYSDLLPDPLPTEGEVYDGPQSWYWPEIWSPDGEFVLVQGAYYFALGRSRGIVDINEATLTELDEPRGLPCCHVAWGQSSNELLFAGYMPNITQTGLWRLDPESDEYTVLVPGEAGGEHHMFAFPFETSDGRVQGFYAAEPASPNPLPPRPMVMVSVAGDGSAELVEMRDDYYVVGEADWLADGSGAVITDIAGERGWAPGPLRWLPADGSPMISLPAEGRFPQWGVPRPN